MEQISSATQQLETVRAAIKVLGGKNSSGKSTGKKRSVSKAVKVKIAKAQRARWAKIKSAKKG